MFKPPFLLLAAQTPGNAPSSLLSLLSPQVWRVTAKRMTHIYYTHIRGKRQHGS